jgi:tRNA threonylcarbamoyladenosine biosynthesis protein TsaB
VRILAFDTATASTSVALLDTDRGLELEARDDPPPGERPRHATRLMPLIVELLERAGGGWEALDRIAVGVGPGTFTGLRIGVATARALAQARELELVGISTLQSLALNARSAAARSVAGRPAAGGHGLASVDVVLAVIDARRGEVFAAGWRLAPEDEASGAMLGEQLLEPSPLRPAELGELVPDIARHTLAIGSGAVEFRSQLERSGAVVPADDSVLHRVTSLNHCLLAAAPCVADGAGEIVPEYLRLPDAELTRRRQALRTGPRAAPPESRE